jgi:hypothetical protein
MWLGLTHQLLLLLLLLLPPLLPLLLVVVVNVRYLLHSAKPLLGGV